MRRVISSLNNSSIRGVIAILIIINCFFVLIVLLFHPIPPENKDTIQIIAGLVIGSSVGGVMGYYYGSSKDKSDGDKQDKMTITNPNVKATVTAPDPT